MPFWGMIFISFKIYNWEKYGLAVVVLWFCCCCLVFFFDCFVLVNLTKLAHFPQTISPVHGGDGIEVLGVFMLPNSQEKIGTFACESIVISLMQA
jgi:hypothetical protein